MADERGESIDVVEDAVPYRRLAMRVIERALKDVAKPCGAADRETAREFLAGSAMLFHWCRVATLDPRRVIATAVKLVKVRTSGGRADQPGSPVDGPRAHQPVIATSRPVWAAPQSRAEAGVKGAKDSRPVPIA